MKTSAIAVLALLIATACNNDVVVEDDGSGGSTPEECPNEPLDCHYGHFETGADGCLICVQDQPAPFSCADCSVNDYCKVCNSAGPPYGSCMPIAPVSSSSFQCRWTTCNVGTVCLELEPVGDGCPDAKCDAVPEACGDDPSCDCIKTEFDAYQCTQDAEGNVTIRRSAF